MAKSKPKRNEPPVDPVADCVRAFFDAAKRDLKPLGKVTTELVQLERGKSRKVAPDDISSVFFSAKAKLIAGAVEAELTYGDRELEIAAVARPRIAAWPMFGLWEWQDASGATRNRDGEMFVMVVARVKEVVGRLAAELESMLPVIAAADPLLRERMEGARTLRQQAWLAGEQDRERARAMDRSADAFRAGRFREVVELLTPLEDHLTDAGRARLKYARRKT